MLTILNNYQHGFVAIPVVLACKQHGLFEVCQQSGPVPFDVLVNELHANSGHLRVALHLLVSMQWLARDDDDRYSLTPRSTLHRHIPEDITSLFAFPMQDYIAGSTDSCSLKPWVELSGRRWGIRDTTLAHFLDGLLLIPLLLALRACTLPHASDPYGEALLAALPAVARGEITTLFTGKGWLDQADRPSAMGGPSLNDAGRFMIQRSLITAAVASYRPMLMNIAEVLFGQCAAVFARDSAGHETHVDRTLNVVGSGFQHARYFDQMEECILAVFNREPYEDQPRYVADMGCGDGTLLRTIYDVIKSKSSRGKVLDRYPVKLIGVDYNMQALEATARTLHGYDHLVLQGDIGDPSRLIEDLRAQGIQDPEHILHVRSFLDHDRPYQPPLDPAAVNARAHLAYHGVYVDRAGRSLPPAAVVQSLVEHLKGWSSIIGHHGLMMLEVHCLEPRTIARFINQCESLHMDAYHRFSQQLLVEADRFIMAAAESGLYPDWAAFRKYPTRLPYTRITLSYLRKRGYTTRHPGRADVPALAAFERRCLPESRTASAEEIGRRVSQYPEGQCLLEVDGRLLAVAYSQRVPRDTGRAEQGDAALPGWAHAADGAAAELLYAVCPGAEDKALGHDLVTFMKHYVALKDGVEVVIGEARCERFLALSDRGQDGMMATLRDYMDGQVMDAEADTRAPEAELSAFGRRWLLRIFQDMGVTTTPDHVYDLPDLIRRLGILPKYERLCAALLRLLAREHVLRLSGERIQMMPRASAIALRDVETECERFAADFRARYAAFQPLLELMYRCLGQLADVLTGRIEANDVVFANGSVDAFAGMFRGNRVADYFNGLVAEIALARMTTLHQHSPEARLSILEIGAGTGSATRVVVEKIQHLAGALTFCYSDISSSFTRRGEKTFGARFPWMRFARLNIEEDLLAQGFQPESFDLVYAANVLHDTRSIAHTLAQVKALLKPGGLLILNEFTAMKDFLLFTGALLHGYWLFEDPDLRLQDSCLLSVDRWQEALTAAGFQQVEALGLPGQQAPTGQSVMLCEKSGKGDVVRESPTSMPAMTDRGCAAMIEDAVREIIGPDRMAALAPHMPFMESGLDSMELLDLRMLLSQQFALDLDVTFLFQQNTLQKVHAFFQQRGQPLQPAGHLGPRETTARAADAAWQAPSPAENIARPGDVAIIGVALQLPGQVRTLEEFWALLQAGTTAVGGRPAGRRHWPPGLALATEKPHLSQGGFLQQIDTFDAGFFRISPREAELLDPQQRLLLELCWEVIEDAGYRPSALRGSDTGVFIGACHFDYRRLLEEQGLAVEALAATGASGSILANRLSYFYDLQGPSMVLDTACSSSLLAVHAAVRALRDGSCKQALVGGVNLICHGMNSLSYDQAGMLSRDGICSAFDARANGYVRGEGAALVFLKRLDQAVRDGDPIYAVIKGSAVNHGGQASSLTAPNPEAQARLLATAWRDAEVTVDSVTYIETHGTGTPLGDPIEVEGIRQAIAYSQPDDAQRHTCGLGSVKSTIGHLEAAAGVVGLIKVLLCLQHQTLPRSINFQRLNPEIKLAPPLYIVDRTQPWQARRDRAGRGLPRRAGVSSFGFGGANAHVVLEEFPQETDDDDIAGPYLFVLSARNRERLLAYAERFVAFLERPQAAALSMASMTYTLQTCREEMDERLAILCTDLVQLRDALQRFSSGQEAVSNLHLGNAQRSAAEYALLTSGTAGHAFIENVAREGDYERLALLWIKGARVDWSTVFDRQPPTKARLPTYPFAQERYWLPDAETEGVTPPSAPNGHAHAVHEPTPLPAQTIMAADHDGDDDHTLLLTPVWASVHRAGSAADRTLPDAAERVVIVGYGRQDGVEGSAGFCQALRRRYPGAQLLYVRPEDSIEGIAASLADCDSRLGGAVDHIFWVAPTPYEDSLSILQRDLVEDQQKGVLSLFRLIKALLRAGYGTRTLGWTVVTTRAQPVHTHETADPTHAGIHGLIGSLAGEFPHWKIRLIDLEEPRAMAGHVADPSLEELLTLPPAPEGHAWVCRGFSDGTPRWFRQQLVPVAYPVLSSSLYRVGGVYVAIGGAGGIGEVWSEYMLRTYGARLVWINRRPKDDAVQAKLDRLARLGPAPHYISADATDEAALRRAYEEVKARYGQVNGVVHAALVLLDQGLANMDEERFRAGLSAKVEASVQMARVFQQEPLDFILLFSSIMTFLKAPGQSNYAAGCTFQDALAHRLGREWSSAQGGPVVKVMYWGYWGGAGVVASDVYRERMAKAGFDSIAPRQAMAALEVLLAGPLDRLALVRTVKPLTARHIGESPFFHTINRSERITVVPDRRQTPAVLEDLRRRLDGLAAAPSPLPAGGEQGRVA